MTIVLPFDSHNHVHLGTTEPARALHPPSSSTGDVAASGMAIMSTHPRDYPQVLSLSQNLPRQYPGVRIVPCFGVHPWWLHELSEQDWEEIPCCNDSNQFENKEVVNDSIILPRWIHQLEDVLLKHPNAIVGECGLDAFHFDPVTKDLVSPLDLQIRAFQLQMEVAARHQRPVSVHCVQALGPMMDVLQRLKKQKRTAIPKVVGDDADTGTARKRSNNPTMLPPAIYFHAFGGKSGTVDQIVALCRGSKCYFGFAPVINFRSPKTAEVVRRVGIERLLLETDHEEAVFVPESLQEGVQFYAEALGLDKSEVVERTTANAYEFYGIKRDS